MADSTTQAEVAALRTDLDTLRALVSTLDAELRRAQTHVDLTMRNHLRCRACSCRRIAHATQILDRAESNTRESMALYQPSFWRSKTVGELEAYVCTKCGLVEWWVKDPGALEPHDKYMAILDGEALDGKAPYR